MPIELTCTCGRTLNLRDELAGSYIRCPGCAATIQVPSRSDVLNDGFVVGSPPPIPPKEPPTFPPTSRPPPLPPISPPDDYDDDQFPDHDRSRPIRRRRRKRPVFLDLFGYGKLNTRLLNGCALIAVVFLVLCFLLVTNLRWLVFGGPYFGIFLLIFLVFAIIVGLISMIK